MEGQIQLKSYISDQSYYEEDLPLLTISAQLPCWEGPDGKWLNRYYRAYAQTFSAYCRKNLFPQAQLQYRLALEGGDFSQWQAVLSTKITFQNTRLLSLCIDSEIDSGIRRSLLRRSDTWDLLHRSPLSFSNLFPRGRYRRGQLWHTVAAQLPETYPADAAPNQAAKLRNMWRRHDFYLTEDGLHLYYQPDTVLPVGIGFPDFRLPYDTENGPFPPSYFDNK